MHAFPGRSIPPELTLREERGLWPHSTIWWVFAPRTAGSLRRDWFLLAQVRRGISGSLGTLAHYRERPEFCRLESMPGLAGSVVLHNPCIEALLPIEAIACQLVQPVHS